MNGTPRPQGSKRHVGNGRLVEMSKGLAEWRGTVRAYALATVARERWHYAPGEPFAVKITFVIPRPAGHLRTGKYAGQVKESAPLWPAVRPDIDKLARAVLDGLTGAVFSDDGQVAVLTLAKVYKGTVYRNSGAIIEVEAL